MAGIWRDWKRIWMLSVAGSIGLLLGIGGAASQDEDDAAWQSAQSTGSMQAFQEYLDRFPTGRHSAAAFACIVVQAKGFELEGGVCGGGGPATDRVVGRSVGPQGGPVADPVGATGGAPAVGSAAAAPPQVY